MKRNFLLTIVAATAFAGCYFQDSEAKPMNDELNSVTGTLSDSNVPALDFTIRGAKFKMVFVERGTFTMGSDDKTVEFSESPAHKVTLTKDFYVGETEVTERLWNAIVGKSGGNAKLPKTSVTWKDCQKFAQKLTEIVRGNGLISGTQKFALPTEAQWEFAAKGGVKSRGYKFAGGNDIDVVAVTRENSGTSSPITVKTKKCNELGLYDMSGNAYEWVGDYSANYSAAAQIDPQNTVANGRYVKRGGSNYHAFKSEPYLFTTTGRYFYGSTDWTIGLRLALVEE